MTLGSAKGLTADTVIVHCNIPLNLIEWRGFARTIPFIVLFELLLDIYFICKSKKGHNNLAMTVLSLRNNY